MRAGRTLALLSLFILANFARPLSADSISTPHKHKHDKHGHEQHDALQPQAVSHTHTHEPLHSARFAAAAAGAHVHAHVTDGCTGDNYLANGACTPCATSCPADSYLLKNCDGTKTSDTNCFKCWQKFGIECATCTASNCLTCQVPQKTTPGWTNMPVVKSLDEMKAWVASKVPADHVANKMQNFGLGPQGVFPIWQGWCNHFTGDYQVDPIDLKTHWPTNYYWNLEEFSDPSLGKCTSTGLTCGLDSACTPDETCKANGGYCVCFMPLLPPNICRCVIKACSSDDCPTASSTNLNQMGSTITQAFPPPAAP